MSETVQILIALCVLGGLYVLSRKFHTWRIEQTYALIIKDLKRRKALDPSAAVELPFTRRDTFRVGLKDYRPKALEYLIFSNIVGRTESGRYYLKKSDNSFK